MKKHITLLTMIAVSLHVIAWNSPISLPDVGQARLHVVGQNAQNYITDFTASNKSCWDWDDFNSKTDKMAQVFIALDADIIAICEAQRNDTILGYLCRQLNYIYGDTVFTYILDGIEGTKSADGYVDIKSGFIYRKDKVTPVGYTSSPYNSNSTYHARLRIQAFKENATNEKFVLSLNHFKAKSAYDDGENTRMVNVSRLLNALNYVSEDPDILIVGDLNAYTEERPVDTLIQAGYAEQLVRFDPNAYSYVYYGTQGLLDHALANSSMAEQITGAQVYHINNGSYYGVQNYHYSDHDPYVVGLNLGSSEPPVIEDTTTVIEDTIPASGCPTYEYDFRNGLGDWTPYYTIDYPKFTTNPTYGLCINAYNKADNADQWLISPALDLRNALSATLTINHNIYYDNGTTGDYETDQTVWISSDYVEGQSVENYNWQQLPLSRYAVKSYVDATSTIPEQYLTNNIHIAFRYIAGDRTNANYWEIKTAKIDAECEEVPTESIETASPTTPKAQKLIYQGQLYILFNGMWFDTMGRRIAE